MRRSFFEEKMNLFKTTNQAGSNPRFSLQHAIQVCGEVQKLEAQLCFDEPTMLKALRELAEVLVYTDKHDEMVFDHLMSLDPMNTLEHIATNADSSRTVKLQIMQSLTIFFQNLTRVSSVYLAFSNNHLNRIIALEPDASDDELTSMYISLLKSLALRLNKDTAQLFFETCTGAFPLFDKAVKLLRSSDAMVRTAAKQIVVTIAQIEDDAIARFLHRAMEEVYVVVANSVADQLIAMGKISQGSCLGEHEASGKLLAIQKAMEDIVDDLYYYNDLCHTPQPNATKRLIAILSEYLLQPIYTFLLCELKQYNLVGVTPKEGAIASNGACMDENGEDCAFSIFLALRVDVPITLAIGFLARWAEVNDVQLLHSYFAWMFLSYEGVPDGEDTLCCGDLELDGLISAILCSERADLYQVALLFWLAMRSKLPSELTHFSTTTSEVVRKNDFFGNPLVWVLGRFVPQFSYETVEPVASPRTAPLEAFLSPLSELNGDIPDPNTIAILRTLFTVLHFLVRKSSAGSLSDLYLVVQSISHELARSPIDSLQRFMRKIADTMLKDAQMEVRGLFEHYARLCEVIQAAKEAEGPAGLKGLLERIETSTDMVVCLIGLDVHDARVALFLALKEAWRIFESDVIPFLAKEGKNKAKGRVYAQNPAALLPPCSFQAEGGCALHKTLALFCRPPLNIDEREVKVMLNWLLLRKLLGDLTGKLGKDCEKNEEASVNSLEAHLRRLSTVSEPNSFFPLPSTRCYSNDGTNSNTNSYEDATFFMSSPSSFSFKVFYCEFVIERSWSKQGSLLADAGCGLWIAFTENELLFCSVAQDKMVANNAEESFYPVLSAWNLGYVRAAGFHPLSFRVVVEYHRPLKEAEIHLAFRTAEDGNAAVDHINAHTARYRSTGAAVCNSFFTTLV